MVYGGLSNRMKRLEMSSLSPLWDRVRVISRYFPFRSPFDKGKGSEISPLVHYVIICPPSIISVCPVI